MAALKLREYDSPKINTGRKDSFMCDYSLHAQKTRKAEVDDKLEVSGFPNTITKGMHKVHDFDDTATCLLPGTEVAFSEPPIVQARSTVFDLGVGPQRKIDCLVARFRQIDLNSPMQHHDAFEFANGEIVLINDLVKGARLTVLQLGVEVVERPTVDALVNQISGHNVGVNFANPSYVQGGLTSSEGQRIGNLVAGISAPAR